MSHKKKKKKKNRNVNLNRQKPGLDSVYETFFSQAPSDKFGNGYVTGYWKASLLLLTFIPYLFILIDSNMANWSILTWSAISIVFFIMFIFVFSKNMAYDINPFDYVTFQFINFICLCGHYAFTYFSVHLLYPKSFNMTFESVELIDYLILSFGTVTTAGSKLEPTQTVSKILSLVQLSIGIWYFITIIPVAIGYQAERLREFHIARKRTFEELEKAIKKGRLKDVKPEN